MSTSTRDWNWLGLLSLLALFAGFMIALAGVDLYYKGSGRLPPLWWKRSPKVLFALAHVLALIAIRRTRFGWAYLIPLALVWVWIFSQL